MRTIFVKAIRRTFFLIAFVLFISSCSISKQAPKTRIIFDTDANNELDDQHAMAYLLFNQSVFEVEGVTVNATHSGGDINMQYAEAERIMKLTKQHGKIPLYKGADKSFSAIKDQVANQTFDGSDAVNFIITSAKKDDERPLILLAVGKLTNVALALEKDPSISSRVRIVWLGSNYPDPGEYNQDNDTIAMNFILNKNVPFEMVTVRYGKSSGTAAVTATKAEIEQKMPGLGPKVDTPVTGRHDGDFSNFGDYSVSLFQHIDYHDTTMSRALFDMVAVAILKEPKWGQAKKIPSPILINNVWVERPANGRTITVWENFRKEDIMRDFYESMRRGID